MKAAVVMLAVLLIVSTATGTSEELPVERKGACDASAAARLSDDLFVIASDESTKEGKTVLRVYDFIGTSKSQYETDITEPLEQNTNQRKIDDPDKGEADIEAAARIGDRIYWITSHGHSSNGFYRPERRKLFVTSVRGQRVTPVGRVYTQLVEDLVNNNPLHELQKAGQLHSELAILAKAGTEAQVRAGTESAGIPPEEGGLNIEGLAKWGDQGVIIGLRSPLAKKSDHELAILIPILNPDRLVEAGSAEHADFGPPLTLDLRGNGVRDIFYWASRRIYVILAGPSGPKTDPHLFIWSGKPADTPKHVDISWPASFAAEAVINKDNRTLLIFSDDGDYAGFSVDGKANKKLEDGKRRFRSIEVTLEPE